LDLVRRVGGEPESQEAGELADHLVRPRDAPLEHQRRDGVEAVEQEVRVDLAVQRAKLRHVRAVAYFGSPLLLLADVEAVRDGKIHSRPGEEEPGPEGDRPDCPGPGEAAEIEARVDGGLDEEHGPGKDLSRYRSDYRQCDHPPARGRQPAA